MQMCGSGGVQVCGTVMTVAGLGVRMWGSRSADDEQGRVRLCGSGCVSVCGFGCVGAQIRERVCRYRCEGSSVWVYMRIALRMCGSGCADVRVHIFRCEQVWVWVFGSSCVVQVCGYADVRVRRCSGVQGDGHDGRGSGCGGGMKTSQGTYATGKAKLTSCVWGIHGRPRALIRRASKILQRQKHALRSYILL